VYTRRILQGHARCRRPVPNEKALVEGMLEREVRYTHPSLCTAGVSCKGERHTVIQLFCLLDPLYCIATTE
jgi:hypothetical protein